jgi:hypothetical protein
MNKMFLLGRDRMGISKQELVSMLEEDELKDAILGKRRIFFHSYFHVAGFLGNFSGDFLTDIEQLGS